MTDCNEDLIMTARANVAERQTAAQGRACLKGEWYPIWRDGQCIAGTLVQAEVERLLREPVLAGGDDA